MRLELNFELIANSLNKAIFIYKIEQNLKQNKKEDIRDAVRRISYSLYTNFIKNDYDILYYTEYIYIDHSFKIFLFLVCEEEVNRLVQETVLQYEYIQEYSYNESHKKLSFAFMKNNYKKLLRTFLDNYLIECKCEKMGDFYLLNKLSTPSLQQNSNYADYAYYLAFIITNDNIKLKALHSSGNCFYCSIVLTLESGIVYVKECIDYFSFKKAKGAYYNRKYLTELKVYSQGKGGLQLIDTKTHYCASYRSISSKLLLCYPFIYFSKSKFAFPYMIDTAISLFQQRAMKRLLFDITIGNILMEQSDVAFVNTRLNLFNEEDVVVISQRISELIDKQDRIYPFLYIYDQYFQAKDNEESQDSSSVFSHKMDIFNQVSLAVYYNITQFEEIFVAGFGKDSESFILKVDKAYSLLFEYKVLEFYLLINEYNNFINENQDDSQGTDSSLSSSMTKSVSSENHLKHKNKENKGKPKSVRQEEPPVSFKKSSLKPYNKEEILTQSACEVDYGNKCFTKKDLKKREQDIKTSIKMANEKLQTQFEGQFLKSTFLEDKKKVLFSIQYDKDSLFYRLHPKKQE